MQTGEEGDSNWGGKRHAAPDPMRRIAVRVKDATKAYGRGPPILNHFDMTVPRGTIYGLLGASGCGKTTILSCIVGLRKLDSGDVDVYGATPGTKESGIPGKTIGYMPQDIALYQKFSIKEILHYFGGIYGMSKSEIDARTDFLMGFLDLPETTRRIGSLSGGQQRRVSLAVSMVHTPPLLILDEPTVGVDPLIRESIWEYLVQLVKPRRVTVIITTHYIEEARQSDNVGLMRNGRLLTESPPQALLEEHGVALLEDIVLKLCKKDGGISGEGGGGGQDDEVSEVIHDQSFHMNKKKVRRMSAEGNDNDNVTTINVKARTLDDDVEKPVTKAEQYRRRQSVIETVNNSFARQSDKVLSLVIRNFLTLFRNPIFVFGLLIIPTFQTVLFNYIVGKHPVHKHFGVVNEDFANHSSVDFCSQRVDGCFNPGVSCDYLNRFGNKLDWDEYETLEPALKSIRKGEAVGAFVFPENFTLHMKNRALHRKYADNATLDGSTIKVHMDFSDRLMNIFMLESIYDMYLEFSKTLVSNCGGDPSTVEIPLKFNAIYGSNDSGTIEYMQPPQLLLIMFLLPMTVAVTYIWDKKAGTLDRTLVAGVDFSHVILSLIVSEGLMMILELSICLSVLILGYNFNIQGSTVLTFILALLMGICGLSFGFLFGALCEQEIEVFVCVFFVYLPTMVSSGGTWPREGMDPWAKFFTDFLPVTLPSESIRSIVNRGWGLEHDHVWPGFLVLIVWITICLTLSIIISRMKR